MMPVERGVGEFGERGIFLQCRYAWAMKTNWPASSRLRAATSAVEFFHLPGI